jgi:ribose transport system permease protein
MDDKSVTLSPVQEKFFSLETLRWLRKRLIDRQEFVVLLLLLVIGSFLTLWTDTFLTLNNLSNLFRNFSWLAIVALGESMVIIAGGIDLSVGATMALGGLIAARCMQLGLPVPVAIVAGLLTGSVTGWLNGTIIARVRLPPFIVTLGMMSIARGVAFGLTGGWPIRDLPEDFRMLGQYDLPLMETWSMPLPVFFVLAVALLVNLLLNQTVAGRYIYTLSRGERSLLVSGVNVVHVKALVYTLCGLLAAMGGILMTARLGVASSTAATGYELDIIAAAVIGGTSLFGGVGSILGVLLGAGVMQMLRNGLVLLGFPAYWQPVAIGTVILGAILLDHWRQQR